MIPIIGNILEIIKREIPDNPQDRFSIIDIQTFLDIIIRAKDCNGITLLENKVSREFQYLVAITSYRKNIKVELAPYAEIDKIAANPGFRNFDLKD